jgi:hypothetical protein
MSDGETATEEPAGEKVQQIEDVSALVELVQKLSVNLGFYRDNLNSSYLDLWMLNSPRELLLEAMRLATGILDREQSATRAVVDQITAAVLRAA